MGSYGYISWAQLEAALLQRLQDTAGQFTSTAEAQTYLIEGLRVMNAQTSAGTSGQWAYDYIFNFNSGDTWKSLNVAGSPRARTVTDSSMSVQMEMMLMEPQSGLVWTGTSQFNITNLENALQFRRDELLQMTGANVINQVSPSPYNSQRTILYDSSLDLRRVRWLPDSSTTNAYALGRGDVVSADAYGYSLGVQPGSPDSWRITDNYPLAFDVSCPPSHPGQWDMLLLNGGYPLTPPTASVLGLPDDWCWVAMYGALADMLENAPEAKDDARAKYCRMRYERGMKAMMTLPWLLRASISGLPVDTPSYKDMDAYFQNWEENCPLDDRHVVVGGVDFVALAPNVPYVPPPPPTWSMGASSPGVSVAFPHANTAGNCLIVVGFEGSFLGYNPTVADTQGNIYTQISYIPSSVGSWGMSVWVAPNCNAGANTVTITPNSGTSGSEGAICVHEYSGVATVSPLDVQTTYSSSDPFHLVPNPLTVNMTTTAMNDLLFSAIGVSQSTNLPTASGYTVRYTQIAGVSSVVTADSSAGSYGAESISWTNSGFNHVTVSSFLALKPGWGPGQVPTGIGATVPVTLTVVGNAPVDTTQPVQLSRDAVEALLAYAQHVATFKRGGADFLETMPLFKQFEDYCAMQNKRYASLGIFRPDMLQEGDRADFIDPRFGPPSKEVKRG